MTDEFILTPEEVATASREWARDRETCLHALRNPGDEQRPEEFPETEAGWIAYSNWCANEYGTWVEDCD